MKSFEKIGTISPSFDARQSDRSAGKWLVNIWDAPVTWFRCAKRVVYIWQYRAQYRHDLKTIDQRTLKDIGLPRSRVIAEATKPFWQK